MNCVQEIGRVTKDIELQATPNGKSVTHFTLAVPRFKRDDGADFLNCVAWGKNAENMKRYVHKGDRIAITGSLQSRNYEAKDGHKVYVTEIVCDEVTFLEYKKEQEKNDTPADVNTFTDIDPDDIPF